MHNLRSCAQFAPGCRVQINLHHLERRSKFVLGCKFSHGCKFLKHRLHGQKYTWVQIAHIRGHIESQMIFHYKPRLFYLLVYRFLCEKWPYEGGNKNKNKIAIVESEKIKYIKRDRTLQGSWVRSRASPVFRM